MKDSKFGVHQNPIKTHILTFCIMYASSILDEIVSHFTVCISFQFYHFWKRKRNYHKWLNIGKVLSLVFPHQSKFKKPANKSWKLTIVSKCLGNKQLSISLQNDIQAFGGLNIIKKEKDEHEGQQQWWWEEGKQVNFNRLYC